MWGDELVEGIKRANETLMDAADSKNEQVLAVYADFVEEWSRAVIDENLVSLPVTMMHDAWSSRMIFTEIVSYLFAGAVNTAGEDVSRAVVRAYQTVGGASRWDRGADKGAEIHDASAQGCGSMASTSGRGRSVWKQGLGRASMGRSTTIRIWGAWRCIGCMAMGTGQ